MCAVTLTRLTQLWNRRVMQPQRRRMDLGRVDRPCGLCGSSDVVLTESQAVRRGLDRLNPVFSPGTRTYERCRSCGAKQLLSEGQPA